MRPENDIKNPPGQFSPQEKPFSKEVEDYFKDKQLWDKASKETLKKAVQDSCPHTSPIGYLEGLIRRSRDEGYRVGYVDLVKLLQLLK